MGKTFGENFRSRKIAGKYLLPELFHCPKKLVVEK